MTWHLSKTVLDAFRFVNIYLTGKYKYKGEYIQCHIGINVKNTKPDNLVRHTWGR